MNMNVDSKRIRAERERRAWSQEHLATAAGVSMCTIQRVEAKGVASYDTAQAIAAVFQIDVVELRETAAPAAKPEPASAPQLPVPVPVPLPQVIRATHRKHYLGLAASLVLVVAALFGRAAYAQQVALDVGLSIDGQQLGQHQLVAEQGEDAQIRLEGQMKVVVVPSVASDGNIALSIRMYEFADDRFVLVSEPKVLAADNQEVEVRITSKGGSVFRIAIKPHKVE